MSKDDEEITRDDVSFLQAMEAFGVEAEKARARRRSVKSGPPELQALPEHETEDALFEAYMRRLESGEEPIPTGAPRDAEAAETPAKTRGNESAPDEPSQASGGEGRLPSNPLLHGSERSLRGRLKRGEIAPAAQIDLHGMRRGDALNALESFLRRAQTDGHELVLVVTGRGLHSVDFGVLKDLVPVMLNRRWPKYVRQVLQAPKALGGEGALAVFLRRV